MIAKTDIVVPENNEKEMIDLASELGYKQLIFLYKKQTNIKESKDHAAKKGIKVLTAGKALTTKECSSLKKKFDVLLAPAQRQFFENKKTELLVDSEASDKKDLLHQRRAGLDQVMCRLAKDNDKTIVFNIKLVQDNELALGRMMQNAGLCRQHKLKFMIASFATSCYEMRSYKDMQGFARMIKL